MFLLRVINNNIKVQDLRLGLGVSRTHGVIHAEWIPLFFQIISPGVDYNEIQTRSSDVSKSAVDRAIFDTRKITVG